MSYGEFRLFLRHIDCEEAFDRAYYNHNDCTCCDEAMWAAVGEYQSLFARVFDWRATDEGYLFWRGVDRLWQQQILRITEVKKEPRQP